MVAMSSTPPPFGSLSTISNDSMVEIKSPTGLVLLDLPSDADSQEQKSYRLIWSKSKTYIHPTAYARDNLAGFTALVKRDVENPTYLLAWIPESLLDSRGQAEWENWTRIEKHPVLDEEDKDAVMVDLPAGPESYAFSVALTSIYSLIVSPPTLSSWHGSVAINLVGGSTLPTLYFHDDESRSYLSSSRPDTRDPAQTSHTSYPPTQSSSASTWGGEDLINRLRSYCNILKSSLQPTLYLIDPSRSDIETHSTQIYEDDAVDAILAASQYSHSFSPVPKHRRPRPLSTPAGPASGASSPGPSTSPQRRPERTSLLHQSLSPSSPSGSGSPSSQARLALLQSFSSITRATRHAAQSVLSHPLARPIVPHLPDPVRTFVNAPGEWSSWVEAGGVGEFESARVYLARWARVVAEEGERSRRHEAQAVPAGAASAGEGNEETSLGVFELLHSTTKNLPAPKSSRDPRRPVNELDWEKWFGSGNDKGKETSADGRPTVRVEEMKREVFRRGIASQGSLRKRLWPFVLGVVPWDATEDERNQTWTEKRRRYNELKSEWCGVKEVFERADIVEERHRIDVDCRRTDRSHPIFAAASTPTEEEPNDTSSVDNDAKRYSTMSPNFTDIGAQSPSNEHIERLAAILLTYNFYEKELGTEGYVQGMSDLCAPIYVVMGGDEVTTFWCFVEVMNRMKRNFLRDQSGMKQQLLTLQQLIGVMDPELYRHLEKTDALNLFFCFRWVLIAFKREFQFEDILRLWEVLWTNYYSQEFVLFVALAVLVSHRDVILRYLVEFDEILKYCNDLTMTIELDSTLAQAEVLFLSFAQLAADIDRRTAEAQSQSELRRRRNTLGEGSESPTATSTGTPAIKPPKLSEDLRALLHA